MNGFPVLMKHFVLLLLNINEEILIDFICFLSGTEEDNLIILPSNTTFIDDCAADNRTVMGTFFSENFPKNIGSLPQLFQKILNSNGFQMISDNQYAPGTTIILPEQFSKPAKVVVSASTIRLSGSGFVSNPNVICSCVEGILHVTADQRVDTIYLPILGSGHGGVDRGLALLFLILSILHFSKTYHHIKYVYVVVYPKDIPMIKDSKELQQILAFLKG